MKVEYVEQNKKAYPKLDELADGTVFSPIDAEAPYIKLSCTAMNGIFTDRISIIQTNMEEWQEGDWDNDCTNLIAVVDLTYGGLMFLPCDTKVEPLSCKLVVTK
jgi:hypothetical protein